MSTWKALAGYVLVGSLLFTVACEQEQQEAPQPPPLSPLVACQDECRESTDKIRAECREKLLAEGALDRMMECNVQADERAEKCRAECDEKFASPQG